MNPDNPAQPDRHSRPRISPPTQMPPQPIDYRQPATPPTPKGGARQYFTGLIMGSVVSTVGYLSIVVMMIYHLSDYLQITLFFTVIAVKTAAIIWAFVARRKALGSGLLTSVLVGILVLLACFCYVIVVGSRGS